MSVGKACAQVAHAASMVSHVYFSIDVLEEYYSWSESAHDYAKSIDKENKLLPSYLGFGTTVVLDGKNLDPYTIVAARPEFKNKFPETIEESIESLGQASGVVRDPTYPLRDGDVVHSIDIPTCFWVFGDPSSDFELYAFLRKFSLYNGNEISSNK